MNEIWVAVIGAVTGVLGAILGFLAPRSRSLESQRKDFEAVLTPVMAELQNLRERVQELEKQHRADTLQQFEDARRIDVLTDYVKDLLAFIQAHVPSPPPPPIPDEILNDI